MTRHRPRQLLPCTAPEQTASSHTATLVTQDTSSTIIILLSGLAEAVGSTFYITKEGNIDLSVVLKVSTLLTCWKVLSELAGPSQHITEREGLHCPRV